MRYKCIDEQRKYSQTIIVCKLCCNSWKMYFCILEAVEVFFLMQSIMVSIIFSSFFSKERPYFDPLFGSEKEGKNVCVCMCVCLHLFILLFGKQSNKNN